MATGFAILGVGFAAGTLASSLGIGGGVVFVPALAVLFSFDQHLAEGTSLAVIVPTVIVGAITHARAGRVDLRLAAFVGAGGLGGGLLGALLAQGLDEKLLRRLFSALLFVTAIRMWRRRPRSSGEGNASRLPKQAASPGVAQSLSPQIPEIEQSDRLPRQDPRIGDEFGDQGTET